MQKSRGTFLREDVMLRSKEARSDVIACTILTHGRPDPKVVEIAVPGSFQPDAYSELTKKEVTRAVMGPKRTAPSYGSFKPRNTLGQKSRTLVSTSDGYSGSVAKRTAATAAGDRASKKKKLSEQPEEISDSDDEDVLSKGHRPLQASRSNRYSQFQSDIPPTTSRRRAVRSYKGGIEEYSSVEKVTSSAQYGRKQGQRGQLATLPLIENASDRTLAEHSAVTSPGFQKNGLDDLKKERHQRNGVATGERSNYFLKEKAFPGNDVHSAINVEDQDIIWENQPANQEPLSALKPSRTGVRPGERQGLMNVQLSSIPNSTKRRGEREVRGKFRSDINEVFTKETAKGEDTVPVPVSGVEKEDTGHNYYAISLVVTQTHPDGLRGDLRLVHIDDCLALFHEDDPLEMYEDLIHLPSVRRILYSAEGNSTLLRVDMAKRESRPYMVFLQCRAHPVFTEFVMSLQKITGVELKSISPEKLEKIVANAKKEWISAQSRQVDRDDLMLMKERKRRRDAEDEVQDVEAPENKKTKARPKLRESLLGSFASAEERALESIPQTRRKHYSTQGDEDNAPELGQTPTQTHTGIDEILDSVQLRRENPKRSGLRTHSTRRAVGASQQRLAEAEEFPEHLRYSVMQGLGRSWKRPLTFPKEGKRRATVEFSDLPKLDEGQCLNDSLIEFYIRYLILNLEVASPEVAKNVYFFNTYFFTTLKGSSGKINYDGVKKWTRNVDLFTYDYVVVPINESFHWYIAVICNLPSLTRNIPSMSGDSDADKSVEGNEMVALALRSDTQEREEVDSIEIQAPAAASHPTSETILVDSDMQIGGDEERTRKSFSDLRIDDEVEEGAATGQNQDAQSDGIDAEYNTPKPIQGSQHDAVQIEVLDHDEPTTVQVEETVLRSPTDSQSPKHGFGKSKKKRKSFVPLKVLDPNKPAIVTLDSLGLPHPTAIRAIKDYLKEEAKEKRGGMEIDESEIKGMTAKGIPQQSNFSDCGLYLLGYLDKFVEDPRGFVTKLLQKQFEAERDWPKLRPSEMRAQVRDLIQGLHREQESEHKDGKRKFSRASDSRPLHKAEEEIENLKEPVPLGRTPPEEPQAANPPSSETQEGASKSPAEVLRTGPSTRRDALASALPLDAEIGDTYDLDSKSTTSGNISKSRSRTASPRKIAQETLVVLDSQDDPDNASLRGAQLSTHKEGRKEMPNLQSTAEEESRLPVHEAQECPRLEDPRSTALDRQDSSRRRSSSDDEVLVDIAHCDGKPESQVERRVDHKKGKKKKKDKEMDEQRIEAVIEVSD